MLIRIEASSGIPITRQIIDQIRTHCASGTLAAGDRLPSVRELARQLTINQNTFILRVYERLTAEGLLELRHGEGTFVTEFATGKEMRREKNQLQDEAARFVRRALSFGLTEKEIRALVTDAIAQHPAKSPPPAGDEP